MSVTFTVYTEPVGWAISCSCGAVNYVASYATFREAYDALTLGVSPECGDEFCAAYNCSAVAIDLEDIPSVNMANPNAGHILDILGYTAEDLCGSATGIDLLGRILMARAIAPSDEGTATYTEGIMTHMGRSFGYTEARLDELEAVARFAVERELEVQWS